MGFDDDSCLTQARRDLNNIEDGFYISPAFLDKLSIHVAKNFLDLPKIKVPLILGELHHLPLYQPLFMLVPENRATSQPSPCDSAKTGRLIRFS